MSILGVSDVLAAYKQGYIYGCAGSYGFCGCGL